MGLPQILIEFKTLAETMITRSERGVVAVILRDNSNTASTQIYTSEKDITKSHYTTANLGLLSLIFMGRSARLWEHRQRLLWERVQNDGPLADALERPERQAWSYLTVPGITDDEVSEVVDYITKQRTTYHKSFKAVLPNAAADNEGIINFATDNIKVGAKTYTTAEYCARIAGNSCGAFL